MRLTKIGLIAAVFSLAWTLFIWLSRYILYGFFIGYASPLGTWPRVVWIAVTVFASVTSLYETIRKPSKLNVVGLCLVLVSITLTIFFLAPLMWKVS